MRFASSSPVYISGVGVFFFVSGNSFFCILRGIFASSDHVLFLHVAFSSAIVFACSGVFGCFWLILRYMFLVCINFRIILFSVGSLCSCVAFSRSCSMSKFICLLVGVCFLFELWRI